MKKQETVLSKKQKKKILMKYAYSIVKDISNIIHQTINNFYDSYTPIYYERTFGLKNLFSPKIEFSQDYSKAKIHFTFSSNYITTEHKGEKDEVFYWNVIAGYHGGPYIGWENKKKNPNRNNPSPWRIIYQYVDKKYGVERKRDAKKGGKI